MRKFKGKYLSLLLLALLITLTTSSTVVSENLIKEKAACLEDTVFYTYGLTTCPHCRKLHDFYDNSEFKDSYVFCYIDEHSECSSNYRALVHRIYNLTSSSEIQSHLAYVPFTVILKNNTYILGIVVGSVLDRDFWFNLACKEPSSEIPVYSGRSEIGVLVANTTIQEELAQLILSFIPPKDTVKETGAPGEILVGIIAIGIPVAAVGGYYLYTSIISKKTRKNLTRQRREFREK